MITTKFGQVTFEPITTQEEAELFADLGAIFDYIRRHYGDATYANMLVRYSELSRPLRRQNKNE